MTPSEHIVLAQRTLTGLKINVNEANEDLLHASIGIATESGELLDQVKKHLFYGKSLDKINIKEELGDLFWYTSILMEWLGTSYGEVMDANIAKLAARYPEKFTQDKALNRDLDKERKILESHDNTNPNTP